MELGVAGSRAELVESLKAYSSLGGNPPLLLFPEEAATNGRAGLLRFRYQERGSPGPGRRLLLSALGSLTASLLPSSSWPFSIVDVVQPVALQVQRPLVTVVSWGQCGGMHWVNLWPCVSSAAAQPGPVSLSPPGLGARELLPACSQGEIVSNFLFLGTIYGSMRLKDAFYICLTL